MKTLKRIASSTLGISLLFINALPVFAKASTDQTLISTSMDSGLKSVDTTASIITDSLDSLTIEKTEQVPVYEAQPEYIPVYSYAEPYVEVPKESTTMTVEEFMALYGQTAEAIPVDTSSQENAYQLALADYNSALAEYEAASQMVETTKDVEVEVIEEVTDEEGNVSEVTRTEIQTVTEMIPAGDVETAKAKFDAAKAALDAAQMALDSVKNTTVQADTEVVEPEATIDEDIQSIIESDSNENEQTEIDEDVKIEEVVTYDSGRCGDSVNWIVDIDKNLTIYGSGPMNDFTEKKPSPWGTSIKSAVIKEGVTTIGDYIFASCTNITNIDIPDSVTSIGNYAFNNCTGLTNINIPNSVTSIGNHAFYNCGGLTNMNIPNSVASIGAEAFGNCIRLTSVTIPETLTVLSSYLFSGCTSLTSITIPDSVTLIGYCAFQKCSGLTSINIPNSVASIGEEAFGNCTGLTSIMIPDSVTDIGARAFMYCTHLNSITIPDSVTNIGGAAFKNCTQLTSITIPESITRLKGWTFQNCTRLIDITLPKSLQNIYSYEFSGCIGLTDMKLPINLRTISDFAFEDCTALKWISIPASVYRIEKYSFQNCKNLKDIFFRGSSNQWNSVDKNKYSGISDVAVHYGSGFCGKNLTYIVDENDHLIITGSGDMYDYDLRYLTWIPTLTSVTIEEGATSIGECAFRDCTALTSITIPNSVTTIGRDAFWDCDSLTSITIPNSVTTIGPNAFWDCDSLTSITIPNSVTTIGPDAFEYCDSLTSIIIPASVTSIGSSAFSGCTALTDVYYESTEEDWNKKNLYDFGKNVTIHFIDINLPFKDVFTDDWYYSVAKECYETGLINGTSATTFSPMQEMTRAMVVTILWRMEGQPKVDFNNKFSDVSSKQWYATSISWAEKAGVVHGYGDGTFKPDAAVTREQVAVMLANYATYKGVYVPGTKKLNTYPDGSQVSNWAQAGMKWALTNGIVSGNGAGYLNPKKSATRAEGAAMLLRMKNWLA